MTEDQISTEVFAPGLKGDQIPRIPEWTAGLTAQYNYQIPFEGWEGAVRFEGSYTDDSYTQFRPTSNEYRHQDSYALFNARANFHNNDMDLDITLFITNIFNKHGDVFIGGGSGGEPTNKVTNQPQTVGIQVTKGFGR